MSEQENFDFEAYRAQKERRRLLGAGFFIGVLLLTVGIALYFWFGRGGAPVTPLSPPVPEPRREFPASAFPVGPEVEKVEQAVADEQGQAEIQASPEKAVVTPPLEKSDDFVRGLLPDLVKGRVPDSWLHTGNFVPLFVVVVDNIAEGSSPRSHLPFIEPKKKFVITEKEGRLTLDPRSYERYDEVVDIFASLDPDTCALAYRSLSPLFQEAYRDLGYFEQPFDKTLEKALGRLLKAPVVEGEIGLVSGDKAYHFADPGLEQLSQVEKHFLRIGPENARKVQATIRKVAAALEMNPGVSP